MFAAIVRRIRSAIVELHQIQAMRDRLRSLALSIDLAEEMLSQASTEQPMSDVMRKRILLSLDQRVSVTGTQAEIEAAAKRMARRTKSCVIVTVPVAFYHVRGCDEHPRGGFTEDGN